MIEQHRWSASALDTARAPPRMATISSAAPAASASDANALEDLYASRLSVDEHTVMLVVATCFAAPVSLIVTIHHDC